MASLSRIRHEQRFAVKIATMHRTDCRATHGLPFGDGACSCCRFFAASPLVAACVNYKFRATQLGAR